MKLEEDVEALCLDRIRSLRREGLVSFLLRPWSDEGTNLPHNDSDMFMIASDARDVLNTPA